MDCWTREPEDRQIQEVNTDDKRGHKRERDS